MRRLWWGPAEKDVANPPAWRPPTNEGTQPLGSRFFYYLSYLARGIVYEIAPNLWISMRNIRDVSRIHHSQSYRYLNGHTSQTKMSTPKTTKIHKTLETDDTVGVGMANCDCQSLETAPDLSFGFRALTSVDSSLAVTSSRPSPPQIRRCLI